MECFVLCLCKTYRNSVFPARVIIGLNQFERVTPALCGSVSPLVSEDDARSCKDCR